MPGESESLNTDDWYWKILLFIEIQRRTRRDLLALEQELRTTNRFFPDSSIASSLDEIIPLCTATMPVGSKLYRSRTIDKFHEGEFTKPIEDAFREAVNIVLPITELQHLLECDYRHMDEAVIYLSSIFGLRGETLDIGAFVGVFQTALQRWLVGLRV